MALRLVCLTFCQLLGWLALSTRNPTATNAELLVLRRHVARPRIDWADRAVLAPIWYPSRQSSPWILR